MTREKSLSLIIKKIFQYNLIRVPPMIHRVTGEVISSLVYSSKSIEDQKYYITVEEYIDGM